MGEITHRALLLNSKESNVGKEENVEAWSDTRLLIIDEVSFAKKTEIETIHRNRQLLLERLDLPYGGMNVVFAGVFRQLEPVNNETLYDTG